MKRKIKIGDLYRAHRGEVSLVVLVISKPYCINPTGYRMKGGKRVVDIVPITIEPRGENEHSIIIESILPFFVDSLRLFSFIANSRIRESKGTRATVPHGKVEATIWSNLMYGIPCSTLEKYLGSLPSQIVDCCRQMHQGKPSIVPKGFKIGYRPASIFEHDPSLEATLADELDILAEVDKKFSQFSASTLSLPDNLTVRIIEYLRCS